MATFSLDTLKAEVEKKYAPTVIETADSEFVLQNMMQLPAAKRKKVLSLTDKLEDEEMDFDQQIGMFQQIVEIVEDNGKGKELLKLVGDNTALLIDIATLWMESSQVGEAEQS